MRPLYAHYVALKIKYPDTPFYTVPTKAKMSQLQLEANNIQGIMIHINRVRAIRDELSVQINRVERNLIYLNKLLAKNQEGISEEDQMNLYNDTLFWEEEVSIAEDQATLWKYELQSKDRPLIFTDEETVLITEENLGYMLTADVCALYYMIDPKNDKLIQLIKKRID